MSLDNNSVAPISRISFGARFKRIRLFMSGLLVAVLCLMLLVMAVWRIFPSLPASLGLLNVSDAKILRRELDDLREDNARLARDLAFMKSASGIDRQANIELTKALAEQNKRVLKTAEELRFYKKIVTDESSEEEIAIRTVEVSEVGERQFELALLLTRNNAHSKSLKGRLELRVQGRSDEGSLSYNWDDLKGEDQSSLSFEFKYFHAMAVKLLFPDGFDPENILLRLVHEGEQSPVQQSFSWNSIVK